MIEVCAYCDKPFADTPGARSTKDHIVPKSLGGILLGHRNLARACGECNALKGSMTPDAIRALSVDAERFAKRLMTLAQRVEALMVERGLSYTPTSTDGD